MTPAATDTDPASYVAAVLILYVELPDTPMRASVQDQWQARRLFDTQRLFACRGIGFSTGVPTSSSPAR